MVLINMLYFIINYNYHNKIFYGNRICGMATTVYRREGGLRRFSHKLDSKDGGELSERGHLGDRLARGEGPGATHEITLLGAWLL